MKHMKHLMRCSSFDLHFRSLVWVFAHIFDYEGRRTALETMPRWTSLRLRGLQLCVSTHRSWRRSTFMTTMFWTRKCSGRCERAGVEDSQGGLQAHLAYVIACFASTQIKGVSTPHQSRVYERACLRRECALNQLSC
jgi:hypothetical protein